MKVRIYRIWVAQKLKATSGLELIWADQVTKMINPNRIQTFVSGVVSSEEWKHMKTT
jgi:hypothetical protein